MCAAQSFPFGYSKRWLLSPGDTQIQQNRCPFNVNLPLPLTRPKARKGGSPSHTDKVEETRGMCDMIGSTLLSCPIFFSTSGSLFSFILVSGVILPCLVQYPLVQRKEQGGSSRVRRSHKMFWRILVVKNWHTLVNGANNHNMPMPV